MDRVPWTICKCIDITAQILIRNVIYQIFTGPDER